PTPERFSSTLWSAGAERSGDPALLSLHARGRMHQTVPPIRIGRRCSLSPGERAGVRGRARPAPSLRSQRLQTLDFSLRPLDSAAMSQMLKSSGAMALATMTSRLLGMVREVVY